MQRPSAAQQPFPHTRAEKRCHPRHMQGTTHPKQLSNGVARARHLESASHGAKSSVAASTGAIAGTIADRLATPKGVPEATSDIAPGAAAFIRPPLCACPLPGSCAPIVSMPFATPPLATPPFSGPPVGVRARALSVAFHRALAGALVVLPAVCRLGQFMGSPLVHHAVRHHLMRGDAVRQMVDESTHLGRQVFSDRIDHVDVRCRQHPVRQQQLQLA